MIGKYNKIKVRKLKNRITAAKQVHYYIISELKFDININKTLRYYFVTTH